MGMEVKNKKKTFNLVEKKKRISKGGRGGGSIQNIYQTIIL